MTTFVIVGGGLAGAKAAETLRGEGFDGDIVLFGDEAERPYERPALAKGYLLGKDERDSVFVHSADWYRRAQRRPAAGDPRHRDRPRRPHGRASTAARSSTTSWRSPPVPSARKIPIPGADLGNVLYLRTLAESEALRAAFTPDAKVVIIGAGWIGLEAAAAARQAGSSVTIVEPQPTALYSAVGPEIGEKFAELHRAHGVVFRFGESSTAFRPAEVSGQLPAAGDSREGWPVGWVVTDSGAEIPGRRRRGRHRRGPQRRPRPGGGP